MRTLIAVGLAVWGALAAVAGEPSFDLGDDGGGGVADRTVTVSSVDDLALQGISGPGANELGAVVGQVLKQNPESTRVRVLYGTGTEGSTRWTFVYPRSVTPLDAQNRPHGIEWVKTQLSSDFLAEPKNYRLLPWKHGARDGMEKEFMDGKPAVEIPWRNGTMHGTRKMFFPDGKVKSETQYVNGRVVGQLRIWDENGNLLSECNMKAGKRHGTLTEYWPGTDQPQRVVHYQDDRIHGAVREFYSSGKLKRERHFLNEAAHGEDRFFDENGKAVNLRHWFNGDPVSKEEFTNRSKAQKEMKWKR